MNRLYAITDDNIVPKAQLLKSVLAAIIGGCRLVQYRDKSNDQQKQLDEATGILSLCREYNAQLIINDDMKLAKIIGADGVHLGQTDGDPRAARALLGDDAIIGVTCHDSLALARQAVIAGASYIAFGRFFASHTKPDAPPAPLTLLTEARAQFSGIPIVAIGGITLQNAAQVLSAGASTIAVSHSLFGASDISRQARAFCEL